MYFISNWHRYYGCSVGLLKDNLYGLKALSLKPHYESIVSKQICYALLLFWQTYRRTAGKLRLICASAEECLKRFSLPALSKYLSEYLISLFCLITSTDCGKTNGDVERED